MNNQQQLTPEQVKQNWAKKQRASYKANLNNNNVRRMQAAQQSDPALFNFVKQLGEAKGMAGLKQLHVILSDYIVMAQFNGGQEN